ncbi:Ig-like domain-containing protein [Priestia megaterium]
MRKNGFRKYPFKLQAAPGNGVAAVNADGTVSYQPNLNFNVETFN